MLPVKGQHLELKDLQTGFYSISFTIRHAGQLDE